MTELVVGRLQHPRAGFSLGVPDDWQVGFDVGTYALVAVEPMQEHGRFNANCNVVIQDALDGRDQPYDMALRHAADLAEMLPGFRLIDVEVGDVAEHPSVRMLSIYLVEPFSVALEQWLIFPEGPLDYVISATVEAFDYDDFHPMFNAMVAGFRLTEEA